jgi:calmodulin
MGDSLSENKLVECREIFDFFDHDKDGQITVKELGDLLRALGENPSQDELQKMILEIDEDKSGKIDFKEFLELYSRKIEDPDTEEDLFEGFKLFDKDGSGKISPKELKTLLIELLPNISEEEAEEIIRDADTNDDGDIDFREFVKIIISK